MAISQFLDQLDRVRTHDRVLSSLAGICQRFQSPPGFELQSSGHTVMISEASNEKGTDGFNSVWVRMVHRLPGLLSPGIKGGNLNEPESAGGGTLVNRWSDKPGEAKARKRTIHLR